MLPQHLIKNAMGRLSFITLSLAFAFLAAAQVSNGADLPSSPGWKMPAVGGAIPGQTEGDSSRNTGRKPFRHHRDRFKPWPVKPPRRIGPLYPWWTLWYSSVNDARPREVDPQYDTGDRMQRPEIVLNPDIFNPEPKDPKIIELNRVEGNYEKGFRAYRAGDYHNAFALLQSEIRYSVVKATFGYMYFKGLGVAQDYPKSVEWFIAAALQGHAVAQKNLGSIFAAGYGVEQDYLEAFKWYLMAAQSRDASAKKRVADMYVLGLGVEPDKEQAIRWYRRAADDGDPVAENLYRLFENRTLEECQVLLIKNSGPEPVEDAD